MATNNPNVPANQDTAAKTSAPDAKVMPQQPAQQNQSTPAATPATAPAATAPAATAPAATAPVQTGTAQAAPNMAGAKFGAPTGTPAMSAPAQDAAPVDSNMRASQSDKQEAQKLKSDRAEEQKIGEELDAKNQSADYFQEVANNDAVFHDVFREQARQDRLREAEMSKGDPTRDPVAKQAAMDMNTPEPGALEEAKQIRAGNDEDARVEQPKK